MATIACDLVVAGRVDDAAFHQAKALAQELAETQSNVACHVREMMDSEWLDFVKSKAGLLGLGEEEAAEHPSPLIYYNKKHYIGSHESFSRWAGQVYGVRRVEPSTMYEDAAQEALRSHLESKRHPFSFMDIAIRKEGDDQELELHRVVVELYDELCPLTTKNFRQLCSSKKAGGSYKGSPFHRVVAGGWVQGGDIADGSGAWSKAVVGSTETFPDETFAVKHDCAGIISMANTGKSHSNGSQFFVTLAPLPWLDHKRVAFGRVVYGLQAFYSIEQMRRKNERPQGLCQIYACGDFDSGRMNLQPSECSLEEGSAAAAAAAGAGAAESKTE